jgi:hypothetical protein
MKKIKLLVWAVMAGWLASPASLRACAACFGKSDSNMARSLNAGIFSLLGVVVTVLMGAASFFVFLSRKAAASQAEQTETPPAPPPPKP